MASEVALVKVPRVALKLLSAVEQASPPDIIMAVSLVVQMRCIKNRATAVSDLAWNSMIS